MERTKTIYKNKLSLRAIALAGVLSLSLSGCGLFKAAAHEAENPGAREAAAKALQRAGHAAEEYKQSGGEVGNGIHIFETTGALEYQKQDRTGDYAEIIRHKVDALADGELT